VDQPDNETMEVLVVVAFPDFQTQPSEQAWEQDIIDAVSAAVYADKTLDTPGRQAIGIRGLPMGLRGWDANTKL